MSVLPGDILRLVPTFNMGGITKAQNVYHVECESASAELDADAVDAGLEFVELLMANFTSVIHQSVDLETVEVFIRDSGHWIPLGTAVGTWTGTGTATDRCPAGVALLVDIYKRRSGYNDRKYFGGFMEGAMSTDNWSTSVLDDADDFIVDLLAQFTATNGVVLQALHWNRVTETTKSYTGGAGQQRLSYQRRRKPGVGLT